MEVKSADEDYISLQNPCNYFQEFMRAVLRCLGFNSDGRESSEGAQTVEEESSSTADSPMVLAALVRVPPRPVIRGGGGPQTNSIPN